MNQTPQRRSLLLGVGAALCGISASAAAKAESVRIGGTLALTGSLSSIGAVHKLAGDIFVEQLNARGGLLGRPVEWRLKDDQSKPDLARTQYEQLVTSDKVDLLMGPYATGAILSAMGVAQRYGKLLVHHTFSIPNLARYDMQFPVWSLGHDPASTIPNRVIDALSSSGKAPKTVAILTSKFPSIHFLSLGAREEFRKRGIREVLFLEWDFGNRDFGPIAARTKDAQAEFVWMGVIGLEGNMVLDAMKRLDYVPPAHFHLYPTPAPLAKAAEGDRALALTVFEEHAPFTNNPAAAEFVRLFRQRAAAAGLSDTSVEAQAATSYSAWQVLEAGVKGANSLEDRKIAAWLKANQVDTIHGRLRFNGPSNYGDDLMRVKQVQNGKWVVVWPPQFAAPGAKVLVN